MASSPTSIERRGVVGGHRGWGLPMRSMYFV
jgi:hypothetical protein